MPNDWSVEIVVKGRDGSIVYREAAGVASFYWEFGGGDVVAIIHGGSATWWSEKYPWATGRRNEILERVTREAVRQKAPTCTTDIDERSGVILFRKQERAV